MLDRRKFLLGSSASLLTSAAGFNAHAQSAPPGSRGITSPSSKVIPVDSYIDPELWTGGDEPVGIAWVFGVDISGSINSSTNEYQTQIQALAEAIARDDFRESIFQQAGPGSAAIFVADYDTRSRLQIRGVDFRENDPAKFRMVADMIRNIPRRSSGGTAHDALLENAVVCFDMMPGAAGCRRKHVNVMTDGTGTANLNRNMQRTLAMRHEAIVSSFVTRVPSPDMYAWCEANLTTPANTYRRENGEFLSRGSTVEVATELQTRGTEIGRYEDEVFLAIRRQILLQTASLDMEPRTRFAMATPQETGIFTTAPSRNI